jgi:hypothetical protein
LEKIEVADSAVSTAEMSHMATTGDEVDSQDTSSSDIALEPNHYILSLKPKTAQHPFFGVGDKQGFTINGTEGKQLVFVRGQTYVLKINSNPMHDVYISADKMGWGAKVVEDGVMGNFSYEGDLVFAPNEKTPDIVYYQCQNHKAMGGRIFVVNEGESQDLSALIAKHGAVNEGVAGAGKKSASDDEVRKKLSYAGLVAMSKPAKRVKASGHAEANSLLAEAQKLLSDAKAKNQLGDNASAMMLIDEALRKMSLASQMVPSEGVVVEQRQRYEALLTAVNDQQETYQESYQRILSKQGADAVVEYDRAKVEELLGSAKSDAGGSNYNRAIDSLQEADRLITSALNEMMDSQTVTYELNIDTPEGEYKYEMDRYLGYAELIPVALEEKKPNQGQRMLFDGFVKKGEAMKGKAEEFAAEKKYPEAIRLVQEATKQVQRALRMIGIKQ